MDHVKPYWQKQKSVLSNINYFYRTVLIVFIVLAIDLFIVTIGTNIFGSIPSIAILLSWIWFLLPGLLLSLVFAPQITWWERIPVSFVLTIGVSTPVTIIAILLRMKLDVFIILFSVLLFLLAVLLLVYAWRAQQSQGKIATDHTTSPLDFKGVITPLLIIAIILAGALITLSRVWPLFGDEIAGLSIFSEVIQHKQITGTEPFHGTDVPVTPRNELIVWTYDAVLVNYISGTVPTEFVVNTRPILVTISLLALGILLNQFFKEKYQALFLFCLWCIYLLSSTQADGTGSDFITRIIQDKFLGWFAVVPILIVFFLWFIESGNKIFLVAFGIIIFGASMVHPITLTQAMILSAGFGLMQFLNDRSRETFNKLVLIVITFMISTVIPFYQFIRFNDYSPVQLAGLSDAVEFGKLSSSIGRYRLFMVGDGQFILHPSTILEPVIIIAYILLPWVVFQIRKYHAARLIVGSLLILPILLYIPQFAALAGRVVTPYLIWRLAWPFPLFAVLTIGWVLFTVVQNMGEWRKLNQSRPLMKHVIYPSVIIASLIISSASIRAGLKNYDERRATINLSTCVTAQKVLAYLQELSSETPVNVLSSHSLNFCIPGYAAYANVVEFRGYGTVNRLSDDNLVDSLERVEDVNYFNVARYLDDLIVNAVVRHDIDYVLLEKERLELDFQFKYSPTMFQSIYEDDDYSLYAVIKPVTTTRIVEANTALRANQFGMAIRMFDQILEDEPTNILALYGLGLAEAGSGRNELSASSLQKAIEYAPNESILHAQLASTYILEDNTESAISEYQKATELSPDRFTLYGGLGQVYILAGKNEDAMASFEQAASMRTIKGTATYYSELGRLYQAVNMIDDAILYYEKAISIEEDAVRYIDLARAKTIAGDVDEAIAIYHMVSSIDPWNYLPHLDLGYLYRDQGLIDEAIEELEIACQLRPTNTSAYIMLGQTIQEKYGLEAAINRLEELKKVSEILPGPSRGIATLLVASGKYDDAIEELHISANIQPKSVAILIAQGYVSMAKGQTDAALKDFNLALLYHPDLISARLGLSLLYTYEADFELVTNQFIQIVRLSPITAWSHLNLAQSFQQQGNWERAREEIELATRLEPNNVQVYIASGDFNRIRLHYNEAISDYLKALELDPDNSTALLGLGDIHQDLANYAEAEKIYNKAAEVDPDSIYPKIRLLEIYWQQGRYDEMQVLEDMVIQEASDSNVALIKLADIYLLQGRTEEAKSIYERVIQIDPSEVAAFSILGQLLAEEDSDESVILALYNNMLVVNPESAEAYLTVGQFYSGQGELETAEEVLRTALEFSDASVDNYISLSDLQLKRGESEAALSSLQTAEELFPGKVKLLNALGEYYLKVGEINQASDYFSKAITVDPGASAAYVGLSQIEQIKGDYSQAEKVLQNGVGRNPGSPNLLLAMANFHEAMGKIEEAERNLEKAANLAPLDINIQRALGEFYLRQKRNAEALELFQKALELSGTKLEIYLDIGDLYQAEKSPEQAMEWYQKVPSVNQSDVRPYLSMSKMYESMNEWEKALSSLNTGLAIEPANFEVNMALGNLYRRLGKYTEAAKYLEQASNIDLGQATPLLALAELSRDQENWGQAINYLQRAVELSPGRSTAFTALAQMYMLTEDRALAEAVLSQAVKTSADKQDAYLARAAFYEAEGSWDLAVSDYEKIGELFPNSHSAGLKLVDFLIRRNELELAIEALNELENRLGANAEISVAYGQVYTLQAKWVEARQAFQGAIDTDVTLKTAYLGLARLYELQGDMNDAISTYQGAVNNIPEDASLLYSLAKALQSQDRYVEARAAFESALIIEPMDTGSLLSLEELNQIMGEPATNLWLSIESALQTPSAEAFATIAQIYQYRGEWDLAYSWLQRAVNQEPYNSRILMNLGDYYRNLGQFEIALETYDRALKYTPNSVELLIAIGNIQQELGMIDNAHDSFQEAIEISPGSIDGYLAMSKLYFQTGEHEQSLAVVTQGIELAPGDQRGYQTLGDLYIGIDPENLTQAEGAYRLGLQIVPGAAELYTSIADLYTERLLAARKNLDAVEAIEYLTQNRVAYLTNLQASGLSRQQNRVNELKLDEAIRVYNIYQSRTATALEEFEQASEYNEIATTNYMNALELQPHHESALIGLGKLELASDSKQKAMSYFEQALAGNPHSSLSLSYLGSAYLDLDKPADAIKIFDQIIAYEPGNLFAYVGLSYAYRDLPSLDVLQAAASVEQSQFKLQSWVEYFRIFPNKDTGGSN